MSECPHKQLKKQMVGEFVYYACECGQKFRVEPWDGKVPQLPGADTGTTPPPDAEFEPLLRGELKHGRSCPAVGAPMDGGNCDCGLKWRIRLQTEMTLRNAWEKRAYEAEAALAAAEPPRGKVSVLAPPDTQGIDAYVDLSRDAGQIASATKYYMLTQGLLKQAVTFADDGTVPSKSVVDTWKALLSQPAPAPRKDLAARLESLSIGHRSVSMRWKGKHDPAMEDVCESCGATWAHHAGFVCLETGCKMDCPRCQIEALVAEMRGAKR